MTGRVHVVVASGGDPAKVAELTKALESAYGNLLDVEVVPVTASLLACTSSTTVERRAVWRASPVPSSARPGSSCRRTVRRFPRSTWSRRDTALRTPGRRRRCGLEERRQHDHLGDERQAIVGASGDAGAFRVGTVPSVRNEYFQTPTEIFSYKGVRSEANQVVGMIACRSGKASGTDCGYIRAANTAVNLGAGFTFTSMWKVQMNSDHGDSGAGFLDQTANHNAMGILSGGTREGIVPWTDYTWYTSVPKVQSLLNVRTCGAGIAPSC